VAIILIETVAIGSYNDQTSLLFPSFYCVGLGQITVYLTCRHPSSLAQSSYIMSLETTSLLSSSGIKSLMSFFTYPVTCNYFVSINWQYSFYIAFSAITTAVNNICKYLLGKNVFFKILIRRDLHNVLFKTAFFKHYSSVFTKSKRFQNKINI
jgi:hypothetical protein